MELSSKRPAEVRLLLGWLLAIGWFYAWTVPPEGLRIAVDERTASLFFAWVGLAASAGLLKSIRDRYFPQASSAALLGGIVALGLVDGLPTLLRRPAMGEMPITLTYACFMVGLWALNHGLHATRRLRWLAAAGLAIGGAIAARPDHGLSLDWLTPVAWSHYFPYVLPTPTPRLPPEVRDIEDSYGIISNAPWVPWGLILVGDLWVGHARRGRLAVLLAATALAVGGSALILRARVGFTNRYPVDFLSGLTLLAAVGTMGFSGSARPPWARRTVGAIGASLLAYSIAFGVLASLGHDELLRAEHPEVYRELVHAANRPMDWWHRFRHVEYGPIELRVVFPAKSDGTSEPLAATGWNLRSDYLFVHYPALDTVQFGLEHAGRALFVSDPIHLTSDGPHTLRIDLGSLYPPAGDAYFDGIDPMQVRLRQSTVAVTLDGVGVLRRRGEFFDAISPLPSVGTAEGRPRYPGQFSGRILSMRRLGDVPLAPFVAVGGPSGPLRLQVKWPRFSTAHNEPLLSTGESGRGDLIYVRYLSPREVAFGYDHWSRGGPLSHAFPVDPMGVQAIEIDTAAIDPRNPGQLRLALNGQQVFAQPEPCYPAPADTIAVGSNGIHASTAVEQFTGRIVDVRRLAP